MHADDEARWHTTGASVTVLVVSHSEGYWGAEQRITELAPRLALRGVTLTLATPASSPFASAWSAQGLDLLPLELPSHVGLRRPDGSGRRPTVAGFAREGRVVVRSVGSLRPHGRQVDVLHSHSSSAHIEVAGVGCLLRKRSVLDVHDITSPGLGRRVLGLAARAASAVLVNSVATGASVAAAPAKVKVIHPGVDVERYHPGPADSELRNRLGARSGDVLVGMLGRIDPIKRIEIAVDALEASHHPNVKLVVVGDQLRGGAAYASALREATERRLPGRVMFTGPMGDIPSVMRALDVVINTSVSEPFGRSILEAQASGRAVVASDGGGPTDFVANDVTGLLVPPLDARALREAIERLATDESLRSALGAAARAQAVERFSLDRQSDLMANLYWDLVAS